MQDSKQDSKDLIREILKVRTFKSLSRKDLTPEEGSTIDGVFSSAYEVVKTELEWLILENIKYLAQNSENWEQVLFNRGTINGLDLVLAKFEEARQRHLQRNIDSKEKVDD